jgi:hypothetical protein
VAAQTFFSLGKFLSNGFFFRSCRGGTCAYALARSVFGFCALHKTPRSGAFTANETGKELSTICGDKLTFKSLKRSRYAASTQIGQKLTNLLNTNKPGQLQKRDNPVLIKHSSKNQFSSTIKPTSAKNSAT